MVKKNKILVTGGCGYIGSHTIVDLIENGYDVISIDNNSKSDLNILNGVEKITNVKVKNYIVDLCDLDETIKVFEENKDIVGVIHFAAYKSVSESVENPLMYFDNNINSLVNILKCCNLFSITNFVFSSSCTVYGNPEYSPVTEETKLKEPESPYGYTKQMGEKIIEQTIKTSNIKSILLRYFNPVGAHKSIEIGESPIDKPTNLIPIITKTAIGEYSEMNVFGFDYPTIDGTCIRDFIHVSDVAHAHTLSLNHLLNKSNNEKLEIFNLGTGNGYSILNVIETFEKVNNVKLNYKLSNRRAGDVISIFANNEKAKRILEWSPKYSLEEMLITAWEWEKKVNKVSI
jgi:UDP-glucose 4-epimerase